MEYLESFPEPGQQGIIKQVSLFLLHLNSINADVVWAVGRTYISRKHMLGEVSSLVSILISAYRANRAFESYIGVQESLLDSGIVY